MHSYMIVVSGMIAAAVAQTPGYHAINLPGMNEVVPACSTYNIKWTPSTDPTFAGPVTFGLIGGATQGTLVPIGSNFGSAPSSAGTYAWDVPCDAGADAIYGLKIFLASDNSVFQYSMPFQIKAVEGGASTTKSTPSETAEPTAAGTHAPEETEDCEDDEVPAETEDCDDGVVEETEDCEDEVPEPTHYEVPCNTTLTSIATPTPHYNGTVTTHKPTGGVVTSYTTEHGGVQPTETPTEVPTAGASRVVSGSMAVLAVAAAFLAL